MQLDNYKKWVVIPCEIKVRDFQSRILVAIQLLQKGYGVIIGSHVQINKYIDLLPGGIYFDKSISINKYNHFKMLKKKYKITAIDEEGLSAISGYEKYITNRVSQKMLDLTHVFFCWGEIEKNLIKEKYQNTKCLLIETGNPRFDFYKKKMKSFYSKQVKSIKNRFHDYILISSNFSLRGDADKSTYDKLHELGRIKTKNDLVYYQKRLKYQDELLKKFIDLIKKMAQECPTENFILRPHPSENMSKWEEIFLDTKNINIVFEGVAAPWIIGSKLLIHSSCTTGLEAYCLGKEVVSFLPTLDNDIPKSISNRVSHKFQKKEDLISWLKNFLDKGLDKTFSENIELDDYILNLGDEFSSKKIADELEKIKIEKERFFISKIDKYKKILSRKKSEIFSISKTGILKKFPTAKTQEVKVLIDSINKALNVQISLDINKIDKDIFILKQRIT
jgi:surface carbohydrate biosynthesis protein